MEFVRDSDKSHKGYQYYIDMNDQISNKDVKEYIARLSIQQKADLDKYKTLLRQRKFNSVKENKDKYNGIRNEYIKGLRSTEPDRMAVQNRKDVKNYRLRNKEVKAKQTLTDAVRARKARAEMNRLRDAKDIAKDILNSIIDTIPKKVQQKKNREAVARHRAKKERGEQTRKYKKRT